MAYGTKEIHFEEHIVDYLSREIGLGITEYTVRDTSCYDKDLCLIPDDLIGFICDTQPEKYIELVKQYSSNTKQKIVERVAEEIKKKKR